MINRSILLIDSNVSISKKLKENFERDDFEVHLAFDDEEAFQILETFRPGVIVSEVLLGSTDGLKLCKKIKEDSNYNSIPYIILTSANDSLMEIKSLRSGADEFFVKRNVTRQELMLKIEILLERSKPYNMVNRTLENHMVASSNAFTFKDMLRMLNKVNKSGRLQIFSPTSEGELILLDGAIKNCIYGNFEGLDAIFKIDLERHLVYTFDKKEIDAFNFNIDQSTDTIISLLEN